MDAARWWQACARKYKYKTLKKADKVAQQRGWEVYGIYQCQYCGYFHLTRKRQRKGGRPG